ncbi:MAG: restriction endonuclease subunit S [Candidatus Scalindua sp.]
MNKSLGKIAVITYGKDYKNNLPGDNIPIYGTGGIMGYTSRALNSGPSVLTGRKGSINKPIYVEGDFWNVDTIYCIKTFPNIDTKWFYYNLCNKDLSMLNEATGVPSVSTSSLNKLTFRYFEFPHQRKIARILTTVDNIIEKTEAAIAKYKAIKQGMMHDLFTRGIDVKTGKLRPAFEEAQELYKPSELGMIPKDWEVEIIENVASITTGSKDTQDRVAEGIYPFIVRSQTIERINSYSYDGEAILTAGDGVGTGKVFHYLNTRFDFHQRVYMLYDFSKDMVGKYLFHFFKQNFIKEVDKYSAKTTVDSVRYHMISEMNIPKPSKDEQAMILEAFDSLDNKLIIEKEFLHKINNLKQGLMQDLLTGKKEVVPDPEDFKDLED